MPRIKLTGVLHSEITRLGFSAGDVVDAQKGSDLTGSMYFDKQYNQTTQQCVVWPENYEITTTDTALSGLN